MDTDRIDRKGGVLLLFEGGGRPDAQSICKLVDKLGHISISLDPLQNTNIAQAGSGDGQQAVTWLELLSSGMTFDLVGLAPGAQMGVPLISHRMNVPDGFLESTCEAVCVIPGPHLSGGTNSLPVVRVMLGLAARLAAALQPVRAICWPPAGMMMGADFFCANAKSWVNGGPFPAQALTAFKQMSDGGLQSEGLAHFTGQELRIEPGSVGHYPTAALLAARLVQQLAPHGPLMQIEEVIAPDGSQMRLEPSGNGKFVRVWRS